ncbi:ParB N-terminal domain-containing protein [uncultured Oscillibacter sp.]|uniref:ParB/RepB/Spo0J family partition protein n=1 Tax=uncultured Oscillibacter sp. TaxID=876091 RepID=UPI0026702C9A|nr:ParB N-terminal domain-containing protein [uncultured Oscillibacter sp.]
MGKFNLNQILNDASKRAAPGGGGQTAPASRPATIERLSVFDLVPSEDNFYSMNDIEELKSKIELAGKVLQNFIVVPLGGGKYKVISGHRRRAACISLVEEGKPEYEFVPCTVEADEEDAEVQAIREEIMLIAANSQREKTAWDKIEEARRTRALLERIKQQEKLPGDMRKLVAQTLNTSPAQIGRFDAITRNLCPAFMEELKADRINISTAYELSGLSAEDQAAAFEQFRETGEISIKAARERKQDPPPAAEVPAAEHEEPEAERDEPAGEPPAPPQDAPQPATGPREADGREKIPPAAETPTGGRTETEEQPEAAGRDEPPAPPSPPSAEEERDGAEEIKRTIKQLETLKDYCEMMAESDESGSHTWTLDVDALEFAIKRLEE